MWKVLPDMHRGIVQHKHMKEDWFSNFYVLHRVILRRNHQYESRSMMGTIQPRCDTKSERMVIRRKHKHSYQSRAHTPPIQQLSMTRYQ
ncbi:Hypothetical predicted protein, partial [Mytilus galloprovincialis]